MSSYMEKQIAFTMKHTDLGSPISELWRMLGIAVQTFYLKESKYNGMMPNVKVFQPIHEKII